MRTVCIMLLCLAVGGCKVSKEREAAVSYLTDQIQLDLADKMDPKRISTSFQSLGVVYNCTVDEVKNICIYSFDTDKRSLQEMLDFMGNEVGVQAATRTEGCEQ